jgi:hypothetical protein
MESVTKLKLFNSTEEHKHKVQWMFLESHTKYMLSNYFNIKEYH